MMDAGVDIVPVLDGMTMANSAYLRARGDVLPASHPKAGDFMVPGHVHPKTRPEDPRKNFHDAGVGEHTDQVLKEELGFSPSEIERLHGQGVV